MIRRNSYLILIILIITFLFLNASSAYAADVVWMNFVHNWSGGQRGVASSVHIADRHASKAESYLILLWSEKPGVSPVGFAWEILDLRGRFEHLWHMGSTNGGDEWGWDWAADTGKWHRLKLEHEGDGVWYHCDCRPNDWIWRRWPYINRNGYTTTSKTQIEVVKYDNPFWFEGRHYNIWLRLATGEWKKQDLGWGNRIDSKMYGQGFPWTNFPIWDRYGDRRYWDWEARKP
ncbi:MAG: hypothetical protein IBX64_02190 [Actinobacteria bacterium]|nr:hypothetical protein [Actinomycetota bacterium]